jgi:hypothetical protein
MDELTKQLQLLGINKTPTTAQLANLVSKHEQKKASSRGKSKSLSDEQKASMLWAKNHPNEVKAEKQRLGARTVISKKVNAKDEVLTSTKYVVDDLHQREYSLWLSEQIAADANYPALLNSVRNSKIINISLNAVTSRLQSLNPPRYLTTDLKRYVKAMIARGDSEEGIFAYLTSIDSRVPTGVLVDGKVQKGSSTLLSLPPPPGMNALIKRKPSKKEKK